MVPRCWLYTICQRLTQALPRSFPHTFCCALLFASPPSLCCWFLMSTHTHTTTNTDIFIFACVLLDNTHKHTRASLAPSHFSVRWREKFLESFSCRHLPPPPPSRFLSPLGNPGHPCTTPNPPLRLLILFWFALCHNRHKKATNSSTVDWGPLSFGHVLYVPPTVAAACTFPLCICPPCFT